MGRIPWIVYGLMKIDQGVSPIVSGGQVLFSLLGYTLVYGALMVAMIYLMIKFAKAGPESSRPLRQMSQMRCLPGRRARLIHGFYPRWR